MCPLRPDEMALSARKAMTVATIATVMIKIILVTKTEMVLLALRRCASAVILLTLK